MQSAISRIHRNRALRVLMPAAIAVSWGWSPCALATAPTVAIAQVPMTVTIPAHPQILLAVANSQSMDGDLSGAIYTGSGALAASYSALNASSSPVNYTIPASFTPPVNPGTAGVAPYTVNSSGVLLDNSASRLNVAKAGISAILTTYISSADFALMDYSTSNNTEYTTWVYQMSNPGGFTFTSTIPTSGQYVANPCYQVNTSLSNTVSQDCARLDSFYASQNVFSQPYMVVAASSDNPAINDVLYANGVDPLCMVYNGPNPASPFDYTLANYNAGGVQEAYGSQVNTCAGTTGPTNAGYVPYSAQVMYEERGFGFYTTGESSTTGAIPVTMQSSGGTPTAASVAAAIAAFTPSLQPETNSTNTSELKASAAQSPMAGLMASAKAYYLTHPPTTNGCLTQQYVVLVTDGLPTLDLSNRAWPPLGSSAAAGWGVVATFNTAGNGALISTNDQALTDVINNITALAALPNGGVKTYIIGLGAGVDPVLNPTAAATLTAMAVAGGTVAYFPATSPGDVANDLGIIMTQILAQSQSTASAAVNSTGLNNNSIVYQSQFVTSDTYQDWTGNLYAFTINSITGVVDTALADAVWSAQTQLDLQGSRLIDTWDPVSGLSAPFEWTSGTPTHGIASSTVLGQDLETFTADTSGSDVLQYLRGSRAQEVRNGGKFRNRSHLLGDIVDSNPAYIGPSNETIQSASYISYAASTLTRPPVIYIGADDGMLHAFDVVTGNERFAYIPRGVYGNLIKLVSPYYNAQHQFFVNGSPQSADVQFSDASWHTVLVGTEAQGGNSVFALDVTNPAGVTSESTLANTVLWDFIDTDMGLGFSNPAVASTTSGWQVFVGNGYNSTNQKPFLYALNPQTGVIDAKVDLCGAVPTACNLSASNGLSSVIAVNSGGQSAGGANLVYAGDLQGNLWRVDVSNAIPANWVVSVLFQARDALGNPQPITTKPVASLNPKYPQVLGTMVMFGTGQFLGVPDLSNENTQSIYGIYDPPGGYTMSTIPKRAPSGSVVQETLQTAYIGTQQVRIITGTAANIPTNEGWYIDLNVPSGSGERVVNDPRLESGGELILTTYTPIAPSTTSCNASGSSYLMVLNYATGGSFTTPQFDANGSHTINSSDTVTVTINGVITQVDPVGMSLGNVYASAPTIRSGSFTSGSGIALITESTFIPPGSTSGPVPAPPIIQPIILKGASKQRTAWWEIRQ
jgi:type IV pilus assembly protein PilY1